MKKVVDCYGFGGKLGALEKIVELIKDGYEIDLDKSHSSGFNNYHIYVELAKAKEEVVEVAETSQAEVTEEVKEESVEEVPEMSLKDEIEALTKKTPLLEFAAKHGVEIPKEVKSPLAIKKLLISKLVD